MFGFSCCDAILYLPAQSSAQNIIADFRVNLVRPNTDVICQQGPSFAVLQDNITAIQTKLTQIVYNAAPNAPSVFKYSRIAVIVAFALSFLSTFIFPFLLGGPFLFVGFVLTAAIFYVCWIKRYCLLWGEKVLPKILDYAKNEFKKSYSQTIDIHILYPIQEFRHGRNGRRMVSNWVVVRVTNGPLQQPINAPLYWSSNGNVVNIQQQMPVIIQQNQQMTYVQQPMVMQQQQQMMYQQQPQQVMYKQPQQMMYQPQQVQNQVYTQQQQQQQLQQQQQYNFNTYS